MSSPGDAGWVEPNVEQRHVIVFVCRSQGCTCQPDIHLLPVPLGPLSVQQPCVHHDDGCRLLRARSGPLN